MVHAGESLAGKDSSEASSTGSSGSATGISEVGFWFMVLSTYLHLNSLLGPMTYSRKPARPKLAVVHCRLVTPCIGCHSGTVLTHSPGHVVNGSVLSGGLIWQPGRVIQEHSLRVSAGTSLHPIFGRVQRPGEAILFWLILVPAPVTLLALDRSRQTVSMSRLMQIGNSISGGEWRWRELGKPLGSGAAPEASYTQCQIILPAVKGRDIHRSEALRMRPATCCFILHFPSS